MENKQTYTAFICSVKPNNDCEICSYFEPTDNGRTIFDNSGHQISKWVGFSAPTHCPSCLRHARRYFLTPEDELLIRVPADHSGNPNLDHNHWKLTKEWRPILPLVPREDIDLEEYERFCWRSIETDGVKRTPAQKTKPQPKPLPLDPSQAKPVKMRFKL